MQFLSRLELEKEAADVNAGSRSGRRPARRRFDSISLRARAGWFPDRLRAFAAEVFAKRSWFSVIRPHRQPNPTGSS